MVELGRKLLLTSILSLIAPGSAGQVCVGILLAFAALLLNLRLKPYAGGGLNMVNQVRLFNLAPCQRIPNADAGIFCIDCAAQLVLLPLRGTAPEGEP